MGFQDLVFIDTVKKMPLMDLPVRTTYIPIQDKGILYSPGSMMTAEQLKSLKNVTDIVLPSSWHTGGQKIASSAFPKAKIWVTEGSHLEIEEKTLLTKEIWPYQDELPLITLNGMPKINETVLIHKKTKSLVVADLCFNMVETSGLGAWIILHIFNTYHRFAVSRLFLKFVSDKRAFEQSLNELFKYDFENIIVNHGKLVTAHGKELLASELKKQGYQI